MGVMDSVKKGLSIASSSMGLVLTLFAVGLVWGLLNIAVAPTDPEAVPSVQLSGLLIAASILFILITIFMQSGSMGYVRDKIKQGSASAATFIESGKKFYLRFLAVGLILALIIGGIFLLASVTMAGLAPSMPALGATIAILLVLIGLYIVVNLFMAPYIVVIEDAKAIEALKRSSRFVSDGMNPAVGVLCLILTPILSIAYLFPGFRESDLGRKRLVRILVIFFTLVVIGFLVGIVVGVLFGALSLAIQGKLAQVIYAALNGFVNAFLGLAVTGSFMSYYLDSSRTSS